MLGPLHSVVLFASSNSDSNGGILPLLFLLSGFVFYGVMYRKYRNVDKRFHYETSTQTEKLNMQQADELIESLTDLRNARIQGANNESVAGAGGLMSLMTGDLTGALTSVFDRGEVQSVLGEPIVEGHATISQDAAGAQPPPVSPPASGAASAPPAPPPPAPPPDGDQPGGSSF